MSKIDLNNYEIYYLDYLEGNLDEVNTSALFIFLDENPLIKKDLSDIEFVELTANETEIFDKNTLKKTINESNVDDYIISFVEGDIPEEDAVDLKEYLCQSKDTLELESRYKKTVLPKIEVLYPEKEALKKKSISIYFFVSTVSIAAVFLLLFWVIPHSSGEDDLTSPIAESDNRIKLRNSIIQVSESLPNCFIAEKSKLDNILKSSVEVQEKQAAISADINKPASIIGESIEVESQKIDSIIKKPDVSQVIAINIDSVENSKFINDYKSKNIEIAASIEKEKQIFENKDLPLKKWAVKALKKKLFRKEEIASHEVKGKEILAAVVEIIDDQSDVDIAYNYNENENSNTYRISIGNFEFSRSKRK